MKLHTYEYKQVADKEAREMVLEEKPGIYAWYRALDMRRWVSDKCLFEKKLDELFNASLSDLFEQKVGIIYNVSIFEKGGDIGHRKKEWLEKLISNLSGRNILCDALLILQNMQSPLYIGKTINMRDRIAQHIVGRSDLESRLEKACIKIEQCYIKVVYLDYEKVQIVSDLLGEDEGEDKRGNHLALLLEDIITRLGPAAFNRRSG